jgi:hypothetical protein
VKPDRVHLWSFSLRSWQQMFELAGFEVVYSSYIGGLDWLSVLCEANSPGVGKSWGRHMRGSGKGGHWSGGECRPAMYGGDQRTS